ncbi:papain-like cysteine protease family protein [Mycetohabitans endofungorum]|uniref:papain-like cysteine protease family protein n=1 Tax=Mycetohabitans endofungorum TaxID=417203 RepID=UPI002B054DB0|nr:papain-like cysteine protease family protein [Mycetohabitans endofungorum]
MEAILSSFNWTENRRAGHGSIDKKLSQAEEQPVPGPWQARQLQEKYAFFDVKYHHQQHVNMCGDASAAMLLSFFGKKPVDLDKNPRRLWEGLNSTQLMNLLESHGFRVSSIPMPPRFERHPKDGTTKGGWESAQLCSLLNGFGPIICGGRWPRHMSGHCILLIGATENTVVYHDPWSGAKRTRTLQQFNGFLDWDDPNAMIVSDKGLAAMHDIPLS